MNCKMSTVSEEESEAFEELRRQGGSPLLKALTAHFRNFNLTAPKPEFDENLAVYKDTSSGNLV